ncbi:UbiB domain [Sesbania bispinosa]|nr:UbiB domain [Sesbania bispinosa]
MRQTELPASKNGTNGRAVKMVPANELVRRKTLSANKVEKGNGSTSKQGVNGASLVRKDPTRASTKTKESKTSKELSSIEELKVLPSDESFSWANENYNSWQRSIDVWSFVISLRIRVLLDNAKWSYLGGFTQVKQKSRRQKTAAWLRECKLQLGPTFIKLGQLSSTRSDLFPREFVDELAKLQDMVPAFSPKKARGFIESELGAPINILFKEFEDRPIAAASLGQVHRAVLHSGEKVVVKVQRPGLKKLFDIDLRNLKLIAEYFQRSETLGGATRDWIGIYEECATSFSTLEGIGYILNPDFSFVKISAPYAQELLDIRQKQRTGPQIVEEIRKQANDARTYTMSMPYRVQRIEEFTKQLEAGDLKLRVRVLESERAARKATLLQMATMYTVLGGILLNLGVTFSSQGNEAIANGFFIGAGPCKV